jgi:hypothetical protein
MECQWASGRGDGEICMVEESGHHLDLSKSTTFNPFLLM